MAPVPRPMNASKSPSPSTSAKAGLTEYGNGESPNGFATGGANTGAVVVPVFAKKNVPPATSPTKASRSPSPSMSTKVGTLKSPTSVSPNGSTIGAANAAMVGVPMFARKRVLPSAPPTNPSRSPSPSRSASVGRHSARSGARRSRRVPPRPSSRTSASCRPARRRTRRIAVAVEVGEPRCAIVSDIREPERVPTACGERGAVGVPTFWKKNVSPSPLPTKTSRSPSPSRSTRVGMLVSPTSPRPNAGETGAARQGRSACRCSRRRTLRRRPRRRARRGRRRRRGRRTPGS